MTLVATRTKRENAFQVVAVGQHIAIATAVIKAGMNTGPILRVANQLFKKENVRVLVARITVITVVDGVVLVK